MAEQKLLFVQLYNLLCEMREVFCDDEQHIPTDAERRVYDRGTELLAQCRPLISTGDWRTEFPGAVEAAERTVNMPNREQLAALLSWARLNGRYWKSKLGDAWMKAGVNVHGYNPYLQQVRNDFGPSWLQCVTLKQLKAAYDREAVTRVDFRVFEEREVIAYFPEIRENNGLVSSYMHVGQHSSATYPNAATRPASEPEYRALKRELEGAPYFYKLEVITHGD